MTRAAFKALSAMVALALLTQPLVAVQAQNAGATNSQIVDVELKSDGSFQGKPVDARGQIQPNANVTVQNVQTGQVFRTTTTQDGTFAVQSLPPGVYDVTVGEMNSTVRVWPFQAAPAGSVDQVSYQAEGPVTEVQPPFAPGPPPEAGSSMFSGRNLLIGAGIAGAVTGLVIAITAS